MPRRFFFITTLLLSLLILTGCQLKLPFIAGKAGLEIRTTPAATVFINGKHVGQTPYLDKTLKPGEITVKLVPEGNAANSWETKVTLVPKVVTAITRTFGPTATESSSYLLTLEPLAKKDATTLAIISTSDTAVVQLDDQPQGLTPLSLDNVSSGDHTLVFTAPGYQDLTIKTKTAAGHKLTVTVQLARSSLITSPEPAAAPPASPTASPSLAPTSPTASVSASTTTPPYVEILSNPLGFLRVREQPNTQSAELARATPGQKLPYKGEESNGWYKVEYAPGKSAWVARSGSSGTEYVKLVQ